LLFQELLLQELTSIGRANATSTPAPASGFHGGDVIKSYPLRDGYNPLRISRTRYLVSARREVMPG
jgi:hypothetical protein